MRKIYNLGVLGCLFLFTLLLLRNPFSDRTLIPNFEPFPDALHYVSPALSFARGDGFHLEREGRSIVPIVGPLYSFVLIPFFMLWNDPRMFYGANVMISVVTLYLFWRIVRHVITSPWVQLLALGWYVTNLFITWYPALAMADNLGLLIVLLCWSLLLKPWSRVHIVIASLIPILLYGTKYVFAPLAVVWVGIAMVHIVWSKTAEKKQRTNIVSLITLFLWMGVWSVVFVYIEQRTSSSNLMSLVAMVMAKDQQIPGKNSFTSATIFFSLQYVSKNLPWYISGLLGDSKRFLWEYSPILPRWISTLGVIGLAISFLSKRKRMVGIGITLFMFSQILFLSIFETTDMRYLFFMIPGLLIGAAWCIDRGHDILMSYIHRKEIGYLIIFILALFSFIPILPRLKKQVMVNIKYAETPWNYIAVRQFNGYFQSFAGKREIPVLITTLPPYLVDFYSTKTYQLLPLAQDQEFRNDKEIVWGPGDYTDLGRLYRSYLQEGIPLYVTNYGSGNAQSYREAYQHLQESFRLTEVFSGCYGTCNIYKVEER